MKQVTTNLSEEHQQIVLQRIEASKKDPSLLLDWDDVKNDFNLN